MIPEADTPPRKRLLLISPRPGCEVGESSAATVARQPGPTMAHSVDYSFIDTMETSGENSEFYSRHYDAQKDRAAMRAEIEALEAGARIDTLEDTAPTATTTTVTEAQLQALIDRGVTAEMAEAKARKVRNGYDSNGSGPRLPQAIRECTYPDFLKCQPLNIKGTEGVVGLTQWFEKIESVFNISNCTAACQVKYAAYTLQGVALTWWNSHVKTVTLEVAHVLPWKTLKKMMTDKYCPRGEIKKLETEMWELKSKGTYVIGPCPPRCNNCRRVGHLTRYCRSRPANANNNTNNNNRTNNNNTNDNNRNNNNNNNQKGNGCYECGAQGHFKRNCPKLKNNNRELGSFDVIIGKDWLSRYNAVIACAEKLVRIPFGNEILTICGEGSNERNESRLNIISCSKAQEYMSKGCHVFLVNITSTKDEDKSKEKRLEDATKKTKKNLLKQQYGNFRAEGSETLEQTFSRLQVIIGQLQFMDVEVEQDDLNQKFLTSLAPEWLMYTIVWGNKSDLDTMSLDDLYNHPKIGHFARECRAPRSQDKGKRDNFRHGSKVEQQAPKALMAIDGDLSWTRLPECADDTVTDYSRPSPTVESTSEDDQNRNPFVSVNVPSPITPKPFIKFVKPKDSQSKSKTDKKESPKKPPVKYAKQYRKPNKKPNVRGNQRNWNNLKSHQLGPELVMKKKACFNCGNFNHLAYECRKRVRKSFTPKPVAHRLYKPLQRPVRTNINDASPNRTSFNKQAHSYGNKPFHRTSAVRSPYRPPCVPTVNRYFPPTNRKFSTGSRNFPTANRKFSTASRKFPTGSTKSPTANMGMKGKAVKPSACWSWKPLQNLTNKGPKNKSVSVMFKKYTYIDTQGRLKRMQDYRKGDNQNWTPRQHNMYSIDLNNIVPHRDLTCLVAKASVDECMLWHRRLGHLNFKTMNKLVRYNLVRGLPTKCFKNDHTCTACLKGKQHKASLTDDFSRFTWTFFLKSKDETSGILKKFINKIENLKDLKVKIIRCDNRGREFRNKEMNDFCSQKGIKREFSNARTPQQNGVAERRNRTLIESARTMLADAKLPVTFWAEAVNTACYV
nr:hypothetical protein [Tanacetum cinerariifolium]